MKRRLLFLLIFALLLRLYFVFVYPQFPVSADAMRYDTLGWNLASGNGFTNETGKAELCRPPGYPFFLAAIYGVFGHSYPWVRFFQVLLSILTLLPIFLLTKDIFGKETALLALLIASFYPPFISYNGILYTETILTFFIVLFTYLFLCAARLKRWLFCIVLGVIGGYAVLLRADFIFVFLLPFLALAVIHYRRDLKKIICVILIASLVIAPWTIRNYRVSGRFLLVSSLFGSMLWISSYGWLEWHNDDPYYAGLINGLDDVEKEKVLFRDGIKHIIEDPFQYLRRCFKYLWRFLIAGHSNTFYGLRDSLRNYLSAGAYGKAMIKAIFLIFNTLLVGLGAYGIPEAARRLRDKRREVAFLILPIFANTILHFFFYGTARYQVPIMPLIIVFAAFGLFSLQQKCLNMR